ncbi:MAG: hypothetical protein Ta2A_12930 [Treponemataceae bacterium]|nr:MAG: hypothetical protein Ta2A_12930 [Treponemataceae bacterium]
MLDASLHETLLSLRAVRVLDETQLAEKTSGKNTEKTILMERKNIFCASNLMMHQYAPTRFFLKHLLPIPVMRFKPLFQKTVTVSKLHNNPPFYSSSIIIPLILSNSSEILFLSWSIFLY